MPDQRRSAAFWLFSTFLALSIILMLAGQTISVFDYDLAVQLGLQESQTKVGAYGVEVNRAFGLGDSIVYVPLMVASLAGLGLRKRWALLTTAAAMSISAYWAATIAAMFVFLTDVPGYDYRPGPGIWLFVGAYLVIGVGGLIYVLWRGDRLLR